MFKTDLITKRDMTKNNCWILTEDTAGFISAGAYRELRIGKAGIYYLNGLIKHLAYYPKRLTNTELQLLSAT